MNRPVQRLVVVALALVLLVPVGAIGITQLLNPGGDEQASESPTDPGNPQNRPTVDPAEQPPRPDLPRPEEPAELTEQSAAGAEATVAYMLGSYDYMMSSGDISVWEDKVDPNCQVCVTFLQNAEQLAAQDGYLTGGEFEIHSTSFDGSGEPPASGTVTADFTQAESVLVDDPTLQSNAIEAVDGQLVARVSWDGERWRVGDMSIAPPGGAASDAGS